MNAKSLVLFYLTVLVLGCLSACSGGNVTFPAVTVSGPQITLPTSEPITAHGVITGLDDLTVNNVRYVATTATIRVNGQLATLADLKPGQIVTVEGRIDGLGFSGTAQSIRFEANLIGPLASLDPSVGRMTVMGQPVITGPATVFGSGIDAATYAGLSIGDIVQISGFADATGAIHATRIDTDDSVSEMQLIARVSGLDLANLLFSANGLTVDYSGAVLIDLPGGAPSNGMSVKAIGTMSGGRFVAERLVTAPGLDSDSGQRVQVAGMITRFSSSSDFDIDDFAAAADAGTAFTGGTAGDLGIDAEIVIDGDLAASGRIMANRITFGHPVTRAETVVFDYRDFSEIAVTSVFRLTVTQGDSNSVEVTVDENYVDRLDVTQTGTQLTLALLPGNGQFQTLHALVTMPVLDRIDLDGVVSADLNDFEQQQMTINVDGVSRLNGNGLTIGNLMSTVSGVSLLNLADISPIATAHIDVSGVSQATLNMDVGSTLTGSVGTGQGTGVSTLFYYGTDITLNVATDALSTVVKLGDTRP